LAQATRLLPNAEARVNAGIQAVKLDPTTHVYIINLVHLLVNDNRDGEARKLRKTF